MSIGGAALILSVLAAVWPSLGARRNDSVAQPNAAVIKRTRPVAVSTYVVEPSRFAETIAATGTLVAEEAVELQPEIAGKIVAINFKEGSRVRAGELLVKLNDAELRATHERAKYRRELALLRERRTAQLLKQGVARQEEHDIALNELSVLAAEIELVIAQIATTEIRAPFDGIVGLRFVSEGAFVNAATRIATLQRIDRLKVDFAIPEKYASRIRIGAPIRFAVAGRESGYIARIYAFDPRIDAATRTVSIRASYANPDRRILPGAFANIEFALDEIDDAVLVPAVAVISGLDEKNVYVVRDGKAVLQSVEIGARTSRSVQILAGLKPGDVVVTSGLQLMREGVLVARHSGP